MANPIGPDRFIFLFLSAIPGSSMFPGLAERMHKEMTLLAANKSLIKVSAPPERRNSVWAGGSVLASLPTFEQAWITRKEYDDSGTRVVYNKTL
jgi:actin, other eukaryote